MIQSQFLGRSLTSLNSEYSFKKDNFNKVKDPSPTYYLPINGGKIVGFIPFPGVLARHEMLTASSRI